MNGQIPLGVAASSSTTTLQECGKVCSEQSCPGLIYESETCTCYAEITGYGAATGSQSGYVQVDDTYTSCLTTAEHQAIVKNMGLCAQGTPN